MTEYAQPHRLLDIPRDAITKTIEDLRSVGWKVLSQPTSAEGTHFIVQYTEPSNKAPKELSEETLRSLSKHSGQNVTPIISEDSPKEVSSTPNII